MKKRRVLLCCAEHLLGEALENLLRTMEDVALLGPCVLDTQILTRITEENPDILLVATESDQSEEIANLTTKIMKRHPNLPIILSTLTKNVVRVYRSHELPARADDLINVIRNLPG
ncbi:MAG: hypothetical protein PVG14_00875 [Anaerolineales bacterium]|jgi:short-subunit dehydrogenase involved in D-alanine esterification of teichoic acids